MADRRIEQQDVRIQELKTELDLVPAKAREEIMRRPIEVKLPPGWRQQWDVETRPLVAEMVKDQTSDIEARIAASFESKFIALQ